MYRSRLAAPKVAVNPLTSVYNNNNPLKPDTVANIIAWPGLLEKFCYRYNTSSKLKNLDASAIETISYIR